jgi:hypothetical protein
MLPEFGYLRGDDNAAIALLRVAGKIVLMILFGPIEAGEGNDLCDDGVRPKARGFYLTNNL